MTPWQNEDELTEEEKTFKKKFNKRQKERTMNKKILKEGLQNNHPKSLYFKNAVHFVVCSCFIILFLTIIFY